MPSGIAIPTLPATEAKQAAARRTVWAAVLALTLYRLVLGLLDRTELSTDEAQYWFWGQTFAFGAYSKPPLIGWILGLSTELFGQSVASVRLPAALFHAATALVIFHLAARMAGPRVALIAALSYLTTPAVALGSALMTTDTPMLLAAAVAMAAQMRLAEARAEARPAKGFAVLLGLALGIGLLAKHAMLFWLAGALVAALVSPRMRVRAGEAAIAAGVFLAVVLPHLLWLVQNDFITLHHVQDITTGQPVSLVRPLTFLAEQAVVAGPVLLVALVLAMAGWRRHAWAPGLAALALVPLLIVLGQAVKGPVLANWAVLYLVPGSVLAALWLARHSRLAMASIAIGLAVSLALPLLKVFGTGLAGPNDKPLLARYLGHGAVATWAIGTAQGQGAGTLVAQGRDLMADLSWFGAQSGLQLRAVPPAGRPQHHWEATAPYSPEDPGPVYLLWTEGQPPVCPDAPQVGSLTAPAGVYGGRSFVLLRLDAADCLLPRDTADE